VSLKGSLRPRLWADAAEARSSDPFSPPPHLISTETRGCVARSCASPRAPGRWGRRSCNQRGPAGKCVRWHGCCAGFSQIAKNLFNSSICLVTLSWHHHFSSPLTRAMRH